MRKEKFNDLLYGYNLPNEKENNFKDLDKNELTPIEVKAIGIYEGDQLSFKTINSIMRGDPILYSGITGITKFEFEYFLKLIEALISALLKTDINTSERLYRVSSFAPTNDSETSFISTSKKKSCIPQFAAAETGVYLIEYILDKSIPTIDIAKYMGSKYVFSNEEEVIISPFMNQIIEEVPLENDDYIIIDSEGVPPIKKYRIKISYNNILEEELTQEEMTELSNLQIELSKYFPITAPKRNDNWNEKNLNKLTTDILSHDYNLNFSVKSYAQNKDELLINIKRYFILLYRMINNEHKQNRNETNQYNHGKAI